MSSKPSFWTCLSGYRTFQKLPPDKRRIVFYSEGKSYWPFLRPFVKALLETTNETPTYVSSEADDPGLTYAPDRMTGLTVGSGFLMMLWFNSLKANVLAMSTPDLEVFHVKRSKAQPVHYVYLMHGSDSVFMVLREQALDYFDSVFCSGPHNVTEIRRREELKSLPAKKLWEIGYPYQDELIEKAEKEFSRYSGDVSRDSGDVSRYSGDVRQDTGKNDPLCVLVAPSWSENETGTLETCGIELVGSLLDAGFETVLRPHPRTWMLRPKCIEAIVRKYDGVPNFKVETSTTGSESLMKADILISDWSAIALEYAFSRLRPVLYIDVPPKAINPNYKELGLDPFEVSVREKIGAVLSPSNVANAPEIIRGLCADPGKMTEQIRNVRDENVFNVGSGAVAGAKVLVELANK